MAEYVEASSSSSSAGPRSQQQLQQRNHPQQQEQRYYYHQYQYANQQQLHPYEVQRQHQQQRSQHQQHHYQGSPSSYTSHHLDDDQSHGSPPAHHTDHHGGAGGSASSDPPPEIIAHPGEDWTRSLVKMAKGAELKKHTLTLQLQMTHILTYSANLEKREKYLEEIRGHRESLESKRVELLNALRGVNEEREEVDLEESRVSKECDEYRRKIVLVKTNEYAAARREVDQLRDELGLEPIPSLESQLDEKSTSWATVRRMAGRGPNPTKMSQPSRPDAMAQAPPSSGPSSSYLPLTQVPSTIVSPPGDPSQNMLIPRKRGPGRPPKNPPPLGGVPIATTTHVPVPASNGEPPAKRPRGRPKGSKNKAKDRPPPSSENGAVSTGTPTAGTTA